MVYTVGGFPRVSPLIRNLVIINVAAYLASLVAGRAGFAQVIDLLALQPAAVTERGMIWQLFTYMYLHSTSDFFHILINMAMLWMFGLAVESAFGPRRFLLYYTACGFGAALLACVAYPDGYIVGASGAIYGLLTAFAVMYPDSVVLFMGFVPMRARWLVGLYAVFDLAGALGGGGNTAHFAHLGGLATGMLYFMVSRRRGPGVFDNLLNQIRRARRERQQREDAQMATNIDDILDKISREGMGSLTPRERAFLKRTSGKIKK